MALKSGRDFVLGKSQKERKDYVAPSKENNQGVIIKQPRCRIFFLTDADKMKMRSAFPGESRSRCEKKRRLNLYFKTVSATLITIIKHNFHRSPLSYKFSLEE